MPEVSPAVDLWRIWLLGSGVVLLGFGAVAFLLNVPVSRYPGIAAWLLGALILHDGVIGMTVFVLNVVARRARRIPPGVLAIMQAALVLAAIVTAVVVPEIVKRAIGTANPTILPLDYAANLGLFYAGVAILTVLAIVCYLLVVNGRSKSRRNV